MKIGRLVVGLLLVPVVATAQVPVDDDGNVIGTYESAAESTVSERPLLSGTAADWSAAELEELVGPIALYPDDLLAIVLPASAYPLQIVEAARFLAALEDNDSLEPDENWDDSVVALVNYPEVVELLNKDLDWTMQLGDAVVERQADVVAAVEAFRDRAYAAGNLKSDSYQTVTRNEETISIEPIQEDVIYVPYYEPREVVYYQPRPVYYYYPRAYPVYYYPYAAGHRFYHDHFWGVTTAFSIGWLSDSLHVYHHSYYGHPYYGYSYRDRWWYRRPSINIYNTTYVNTRYGNRYTHGDRWRARDSRRDYVRREGYVRDASRRPSDSVRPVRQRAPIEFRNRDGERVSRARENRSPTAGATNTRRTAQNRDTTSREQNMARSGRSTGDRSAARNGRSGRTGDASQNRRQSSGDSGITFRDRSARTERQATRDSTDTRVRSGTRRSVEQGRVQRQDRSATATQRTSGTTIRRSTTQRSTTRPERAQPRRESRSATTVRRSSERAAPRRSVAPAAAQRSSVPRSTSQRAAPARTSESRSTSRSSAGTRPTSSRSARNSNQRSSGARSRPRTRER